MFSAIRERLSGLVGGSQPDRIEWCVFEMQNSELRPGTWHTTVCLVPEVVDGVRLSFRTSPLLRNGSGHNVLAGLRDRIEVEQGERLVIKSIVRVHVHNELDAELDFELSHPFDQDEETQRVRDRIDRAMELDEGGTIAVPVQQRPSFEAVTRPSDNAGEKDTGDALSQDEEERRLDAMLDNHRPVFHGDSAAEVMQRADAMTLRGTRLHRNRVEKANRLSVGPIPASETSCQHKVLYRASVSEDILRWFAGQDRIVAETPLQEQSRPNLNPDTRGNAPVTRFFIYPADHALVLFIHMFEDVLHVQPGEKVAMRGDRDADKRWYQLSVDLVERAREMILVVVYAQIYYTTLRDCTLGRVMERDEREYALVLRVAAQWGLRVDPKTRRVADWGADAYRAVVAVTLRVDYVIVSGVESSAAALHKKRTMLRPV